MNTNPAKSQDSADLAVLVLAAGRSRRFGSDKRLAAFSARRTLLEATLDSLEALALPLYVGLAATAGDRKLAERLCAPGRTFLFSTRSAQGMGATLADSLAQIQDSDALMIALGDMPAIAPGTLALLRGKAGRDRIVFPQAGNGRGHPVCFGRRFFPELLALDGDRGAAPVIAAHPDACIAIPVDDPGIYLDADDPLSLEGLRRRLSD